MRAQISKFVSQLISKFMGTHVLKAALDRLSALRAGIGRDPATNLRRTVIVAVAGWLEG